MTKPEEISPGGCARSEFATAFVQDELAADERTDFERHLESCTECRDDVTATRELVERLRSTPDESEVDLVDGVLARIAEDAWESAAGDINGSAFKWASRALQAAAVLLVGLTLGLVALRSPEEDPASEKGAAAIAQATPVAKALAWLASSQTDDGSWDAEAWGGQERYTPALTGLATLALLASVPADNTLLGAVRVDAVRKAARFLSLAVGRSGRIGPRFDASLYNHGIATVALVEAYALTREESLKEPITRALEYIRSEQDPTGGWGYAGGRKANTAISVWQLNALLLAGPLGWPEARAPAERGLAWLEGMIDAEGRAGYEAPGHFPNGSEGLTAMAALSLGGADGSDSLFGDARARAARSLLEAAASTPRKLDYYRSFFLEYALRAVEKSSPGASGRSHDMIVESQVRAGPHSGSFEPSDRWSITGGRVYSTAMAALSLQADANAPRMIAMMRGQ